MGWGTERFRTIWKAVVSTAAVATEWGKSVIEDAVSDLASDVVKSAIGGAIGTIFIEVVKLLASYGNGETNGENGTATPVEETSVVMEETTTGIVGNVTGQPTTTTSVPTTPELSLLDLFANPAVVFAALFVVFLVVLVAYREAT